MHFPYMGASLKPLRSRVRLAIWNSFGRSPEWLIERCGFVWKEFQRDTEWCIHFSTTNKSNSEYVNALIVKRKTKELLEYISNGEDGKINI